MIRVVIGETKYDLHPEPPAAFRWFRNGQRTSIFAHSECDAVRLLLCNVFRIEKMQQIDGSTPASLS